MRNETIVMLVKVNSSDLEWNGEENGSPFALLNKEAKLNPLGFPSNISKQTPDEVIKNIRINLDSCEERFLAAIKQEPIKLLNINLKKLYLQK